MTRRYVFADESGNFDFSNKQDASRYFAVATITVNGDDRRDELNRRLSALKYKLANAGHDIEGSFHATTDKQAVRDAVYAELVDFGVMVDATVLDKRKAQPKIRRSDEGFYQYAWYFHLNKIIWGLSGVSELVVVGSSLGTKKKKTMFRDAIKSVVDQKCPPLLTRRVLAWRDESDHCLQAADYMLWAIMRDIERGDPRSRDLIKDQIDSCFQPFENGQHLYY